MFIGITLHFGSRQHGCKIGFEHSLISHNGAPYLERWIIHCGGTLRLHKFYQGDDDRALHDHPWWFATFPFASYRELVDDGDGPRVNGVRRFRFHYRPAAYRHRVLPFLEHSIWTLVVTGSLSRMWGFWPTPDTFVPFREWGPDARP